MKAIFQNGDIWRATTPSGRDFFCLLSRVTSDRKLALAYGFDSTSKVLLPKHAIQVSYLTLGSVRKRHKENKWAYVKRLEHFDILDWPIPFFGSRVASYGGWGVVRKRAEHNLFDTVEYSVAEHELDDFIDDGTHYAEGFAEWMDLSFKAGHPWLPENKNKGAGFDMEKATSGILPPDAQLIDRNA